MKFIIVVPIIIITLTTNFATAFFNRRRAFFSCNDGFESVWGYYSATISLGGVNKQCNRVQRAGIALLMQYGMNYYMQEAADGVIINSQNKLCLKPKLEASSPTKKQATTKRRLKQFEIASTLFVNSEIQNNNRFLFRRRSRRPGNRKSTALLNFVYSGGGRCRICPRDNRDQRRLEANGNDGKNNNISERHSQQGQQQQQQQQRSLFFFRARRRSSNLALIIAAQNRRKRARRAAAARARKRAAAKKKAEAEAKKKAAAAKANNTTATATNTTATNTTATVAPKTKKEKMAERKAKAISQLSQQLVGIEAYVSEELKNLIKLAYSSRRFHCLRDEEPTVTVEITIRDRWQDARPECRRRRPRRNKD